ncbi:MAG: 4Fe-4S binding protein [Dehalococcoidales bacterium]|nr:MAG: 4Fe-4S binding protein [Dehalococcoidales bacterium]
MTTKVNRNIVKIDEDKCNGCGACIISCAEGALQVINGKAKLISDKYCDGLGACLGECPHGAISIEERASEEFDVEAVRHHLEAAEPSSRELPCSCPSTTVEKETANQPSIPGQWPVQLALVPPEAPFLEQADLLLVADCVPFAYGKFHHDLLKDHALLVACPKLDDFQTHLQKLTEILRHSPVKSLTVAHMDVPCCAGLTHMARQAIHLSGREIPLSEITIGIRGDIKRPDAGSVSKLPA